ncbi:thioredoxin domain-containing protein [Streptomyces sp. NPDC026659]|uniref:thioredoxin domain-containing protein n=1 Tax=Streptomyces sp. NPDC026659 TaxID=3155123 RepID=UPI0033FA8548
MTTPAHTTGSDGKTLYYGDLSAPHELQVFLEMRDRASARMAKTLLGTIEQLADDGKVVVKFHFAGAIDDSVGGDGDQQAVAALAAASDAGQKQLIGYLGALFDNQPFPPGEDKFSDASVLLSVANGVDGLRSSDFDRKVSGQTYVTWAGESISTFETFGLPGTPAVWYDKENIPVVTVEGEVDTDPQKFLSQIKQS